MDILGGNISGITAPIYLPRGVNAFRPLLCRQLVPGTNGIVFPNKIIIHFLLSWDMLFVIEIISHYPNRVSRAPGWGSTELPQSRWGLLKNIQRKADSQQKARTPGSPSAQVQTASLGPSIENLEKGLMGRAGQSRAERAQGWAAPGREEQNQAVFCLHVSRQQSRAPKSSLVLATPHLPRSLTRF